MSLLDIFELECPNSARSPAFVVQEGTNNGNSTVTTATRWLSYADAWSSIEKHQSWLLSKVSELLASGCCGVTDTEPTGTDVTFAYLSSNSMDLLLSMMASTSFAFSSPNSKAKHFTALLNTRWTPDEMIKALQSQNPANSRTIILYGDGFSETALEVSQKLGHVSSYMPIPMVSLNMLKCLEVPIKVVASSPVLHSRRFGIDEIEKRGDDRDAMIVFTSGTTGGSKGVRLSHRAIAIQSMAKLSDPCHYSRETVMLASTVPLFHIGGISSCLAVLFGGGSLMFPCSSEASFDPSLAKVSLENPLMSTNTLVVVPAMLVALLAHMGNDDDDDSSSVAYPGVRLILIGGQSTSQSMIDTLRRMFPNARIIQTFACTEAASSLTFLNVARNDVARQKRTVLAESPNGDCVGSPPPHVHLRLYRREDKVTKIVTTPYQVGIIATRGPHLMNGYWSRGSLDPPQNISGWYLTSDLGFFDEEKQLHFCGRVKDVIRSGGETIHAQEVERVLLQNPEIAECAVFARQDDRFGEAVACAVVAKKGGGLKLDSIKQWCQQQGLASYKRPRYLFLVDSLPRNSSGKVLKHKLVETFGRTRSKL